MAIRMSTWWLLCCLFVAIADDSVHAEARKRQEDTCRSLGGLKFDNTQRPRQRSKGLEVCSKYKKNTCCNGTHAHPLRLKIMEPVVAGFNRKCQAITEEMACSACHPFMGTWKWRHVCPRLCNDWYSACKNEFYSYAGDGTLTPCYGNALVCSPLASVASDGREFCHKMGFQVGNDDDVEGSECFDGSVPRQVGEQEPTEPWQMILKRLWEEQGEDPSGILMIAVFLPLVALYLGYRSLKQYRVGGSSSHLTLEEVRRLQQSSYGMQSHEDDDDSSDFSDQDQEEETKE